MAGDWLKVEKDTPEKPEILAMADFLQIDPEIVFAKCFKAWRWADSHTADGHAPSVTAVWLDALVHAPRFADALVKVGWLIVSDGALQFPNFNQHMGQSGKRRALAARRQKKKRVTLLSRKSHAKCVTREEKRRDKEIDKETSTTFTEFWSVYPKPVRRSEAMKSWNARIGEGVSPDQMISAAKNYAEVCRREKREPQHIMQPTTFVGTNRRFLDYEGGGGQKPEDWHEKAGKRISEMTAKEKNQWNIPVL